MWLHTWRQYPQPRSQSRRPRPRRGRCPRDQPSYGSQIDYVAWKKMYIHELQKNDTQFQSLVSLVSMACNSNLTWDNWPLSCCKNRLKRLAGLCIQGLVQKRPKMIQIKFFSTPGSHCLLFAIDKKGCHSWSFLWRT